MTQYAKLSHEELVARCIQMEAVIGYLRQEAEDKRVKAIKRVETMPPDVARAAIDVLPNGMVNRANAAMFIGRKSKTLAEWIRLKKGPQPHKIGGRVYYRLSDLEAFMDGET